MWPLLLFLFFTRTLAHGNETDHKLAPATKQEILLMNSNCSTETHYRCSTGQCIPKEWLCDGRSDCDGGEDEKHEQCEQHHNVGCSGDQGECVLRDGTVRCIRHEWRCDGMRDCEGGEDEAGCGQFTFEPLLSLTTVSVSAVAVEEEENMTANTAATAETVEKALTERSTTTSTPPPPSSTVVSSSIKVDDVAAAVFGPVAHAAKTVSAEDMVVAKPSTFTSTSTTTTSSAPPPVVPSTTKTGNIVLPISVDAVSAKEEKSTIKPTTVTSTSTTTTSPSPSTSTTSSATSMTSLVKMDADPAMNRICEEFEFKCGVSGPCLPRDMLCDSHSDCPNGDDESEARCATPPRVVVEERNLVATSPKATTTAATLPTFPTLVPFVLPNLWDLLTTPPPPPDNHKVNVTRDAKEPVKAKVGWPVRAWIRYGIPPGRQHTTDKPTTKMRPKQMDLEKLRDFLHD